MALVMPTISGHGGLEMIAVGESWREVSWTRIHRVCVVPEAGILPVMLKGEWVGIIVIPGNNG